VLDVELGKKDMVKLFFIVEQIKEEILKSRRKVLKKGVEMNKAN